MTSFAQSAAFGSGSSVPDVDVLSDGIGLETALRLHGRQQGIGDVLADDAASATYYARARLHI